jgi:hypothetical protein
MSNSVAAAEQAGMTETESKQIVAAGVYDKIENEGKSPDDFWAGLTQKEKDALEFSPESLRRSMDRTKFGGFASAFFFVVALAAAGLAAKRGIPIGVKTIAKIAEARKSGASALQLMTIFEEGKILAIGKVWLPGLASTIAGGMGWLTSSMVNNMNDADLWGRIFLGQAADDFEKAQKQGGTSFGGSGGGFTSADGPRTIIRMVNESKPKQFLGTLFSLKLGKMEHFDRKLDDEITDKEDLEADVKLALARWLKTLPGRLGASISIRKDPVDEFGAKQSGIWATQTLFIQQLSGTILPIDTILLGPVDPVMELELLKSTKTFEVQMPDILSAEEVREIEIPDGNVDIFNKAGDRVFPGGGTTPAPAPATTPPTTYPKVQGATLQPLPTETFAQYLQRGAPGTMRFGNEDDFKRYGGGTAIVAAPATTPSAPSTSSSSSITAPTLRVGSTGDQVKWLQEFLNTRGENLTVDGIFGARTDAAVGRFQYKEGLVSDGVVGPKTYTAISKYM